jgi:hypothetical protein
MTLPDTTAQGAPITLEDRKNEGKSDSQIKNMECSVSIVGYPVMSTMGWKHSHIFPVIIRESTPVSS